MSSMLDIEARATYGARMLKSVSRVVHGISMFLDLAPESLVLRAMEPLDATSTDTRVR